VWAAGGGAIVRIKEQIDDIRWGGDAKTVLLMREESAKKWMDIRVRSGWRKFYLIIRVGGSSILWVIVSLISQYFD
jgi:hypothetical protein